MSAKLDTAISRRSFLKWTGAATAATAIGARTPVLHALVPSEENTASGKVYVFGVDPHPTRPVRADKRGDGPAGLARPTVRAIPPPSSPP